MKESLLVRYPSMRPELEREIFYALNSAAFQAAVTFQKHHGQKSPEEQRAVLVKMGKAILPKLRRPLSPEEQKAFEELGIL